MKVDYAITLLENDLRNQVQHVFQLRHKVHPTMTLALLDICHEIRNGINLLKTESKASVSDSHAQVLSLHDVRKSECEAIYTSTEIGESVESALENRIDYGNSCEQYHNGRCVHCGISPDEYDIIGCGQE